MKKHIFKTCTLAALAASVLTVPVWAQDTTGMASTGAAPTMAMPASPAGEALQAKLSENFDRLFVLKAAQGNMAEVMTSQLALQKSQNPQVRRLAQMLIQEHGQANRELMPILTANGLPMPRNVGAMNAATYDALAKLKGARFDQSFMAGQPEAHENTITLYQQELAMGKDESTRAYTTKYLPSFTNHTAMIYAIAGAVQAPGSAERMVALRTTMAEMNALMAASMTGMSNGMAATTPH